MTSLNEFLWLDGLALILGAVGFYGLLIQRHLLKKIGFWCLLQLSLILWLLSLSEKGRNPLAGALILDLVLVASALGGFLLGLARLIRREKRSLDGRVLSQNEKNE